MNNVRKQYIDLIKMAKVRNHQKQPNDGYVNHHILPKSLFPLWKNRKSNLVVLTQKEHAIAHLYLYEIYHTRGMCFAAHLLKSTLLMTDEELKEFNETRKDFKNFLGKHHTEESKQLMRDHRYDQTGYHHSEETKSKISEHMKGKQNFLGVHHSEESKKKISENNYNKTEEGRKRASERNQGKTWWTDGEHRSFSKDCPGEGWYKGIPQWVIDKRRKTMEEKHNWKPKMETEL